MSFDAKAFAARFKCPKNEDLMAAAIALLPRGRAWQTQEGGPQAGYEAGFNPRAFSHDGFSTETQKPSFLWQYWAACTAFLSFFVARLCALRLEFWCATHSETHDLWLEEYALPDACDPFPDLCTKVAAIGGSRCEYFSEVTARMGWSIECLDRAVICGSRAGRGLSGHATPGAAKAVQLVIKVNLRESPSFTGRIQTRPVAGRMRPGRRIACEPNISPLRCLMDRIAPAHVRITYQTN